MKVLKALGLFKIAISIFAKLMLVKIFPNTFLLYFYDLKVYYFHKSYELFLCTNVLSLGPESKLKLITTVEGEFLWQVNS